MIPLHFVFWMSCWSTVDDLSISKPNERGVNIYTPQSASVSSPSHRSSMKPASRSTRLCWPRRTNQSHGLACPFAQTACSQCDTLPCSTSTLTAPLDLTTPDFAVNLCSSRTGVESVASNVVIFQPCLHLSVRLNLPWECAHTHDK